MFISTSANESKTVQFTVQCFSDLPALQGPLFIIFFIIYMNIVLGNIAVFTAIMFDSRLHSPMYIFLGNLSFLDISYTSTILPNLLFMLYTQHKTISLVGCITQMYFFLFFACTEMILLAVMAYDRYVAICHPLHYSLLMSRRHCMYMVVSVWFTALLEPVVFTVFLARLSFCSSREMDHFYCDASPLLKLSCTDTSHVNLITYIFGALVGLSTFMLTLFSYVFIITKIMKMHSALGRSKTFSTCTSHLSCVLIFYGTTLSLYMRPTSMYSPKQDKFFSLLYIILIPTLNPIIYTLKNKQIIDAFIKLVNVLFKPHKT